MTLYGYFPSKQQLFLVVSNFMAARHLGPAFDERVHESDDLSRVLRRFGEKFLAFICTPEATGAYRMMVAQAGQSDIGRDFFELGPKRGEDTVAAFISIEMEGGRLKQGDASVAAMHLMALLSSETMHRVLMGVITSSTHIQIRQIVERAVTVFMAAYAT